MEEDQFIDIVRQAWVHYDSSRKINSITDISAQVSTNHVYKVTLPDREFVIAKLSYYGKYEHFREDHLIINSLSNNLPYPFENVLSRAFMKGNEIFTYHHQRDGLDAWVIFYRPVKIKGKLPKRLTNDHIIGLGKTFARFHLACHKIRHTLPKSTKSLRYDLYQLMDTIRARRGNTTIAEGKVVMDHAEAVLDFVNQPVALALEKIPVFVDWNIGNFSTTPSLRLFSRWDYDWFRMSTRMLDFYFFSRIVSNIGDRTYFHYLVDPLMEDRFVIFLKSYHSIYPIEKIEIHLLKEVYRFFILNYVIKDGAYFFKDTYALRLQKEAIERYLPSVDQFNPNKLLDALEL
jgi:Ser/Thr protein kinase RdoA (MazF antagonist)